MDLLLVPIFDWIREAFSSELQETLLGASKEWLKAMNDARKKLFQQIPKELQNEYEFLFSSITLEKIKRFNFNASDITDDLYKSNKYLLEQYRPQVLSIVQLTVNECLKDPKTHGVLIQETLDNIRDMRHQLGNQCVVTPESPVYLTAT